MTELIYSSTAIICSLILSACDYGLYKTKADSAKRSGHSKNLNREKRICFKLVNILMTMYIIITVFKVAGLYSYGSNYYPRTVFFFFAGLFPLMVIFRTCNIFINICKEKDRRNRVYFF